MLGQQFRQRQSEHPRAADLKEATTWKVKKTHRGKLSGTRTDTGEFA